jgi:hypothetical protein
MLLVVGCASGKRSNEALAERGRDTWIAASSMSADSLEPGMQPGPDLLGADGSSGTGTPSGEATAGAGGTVDAGAEDANVPDAGRQASPLGGPCPPSFECFTDPLFGVLHGCLKSGPLPTPVSCMADADCVKAGLPKGLCLMEEETGLNGCVQLCTPEADAAPHP